uniref:Uncharacterized protein n=1 Tax=Bodo saltans TaxID=75058 RepID=B6DTI0_BODSA|nr:hypothetical protein [Bodo saltans]
MNVLEQVLVERQRRVAPRPRATTIASAPREKQPTTTRMAAAGLPSRGGGGGAPTHQRSSYDEVTSLPTPAAAAAAAAAAVHHHAPLIDFYDPPTTNADHHHSLHDGMQSLSVSSVTREDIELLHSENDAMELFLLRHGSDGAAAAAPMAGLNETTVGGCEQSRQQLDEELHCVVARLEALLLHNQQCQRINTAADKTPLRQLSRQAQLCAVADNVKANNDALMQECTLLEAELDRYTIQSSSSERRRGVPWVVAHSMLPQVPPARAGVPLVVAAAWSRFTTDTKRFLDIATMQAHQARHIDDAVTGVQDGLRSQLDMILGHLRSAQLL